ncbi:MAG: hypothetical protein KIT60_20525 [Burkholderiaceae bacterium]|nr:hypothetical protein [Burkholderiaceae bacterium]
MSGSSGGGGGGGGVADTQASCSDLKFSILVSSPKPAAVAALKVGDVLDIDVVQLGAQVVVRVLKNGTLVGGLAGPEATRLRNCIADGHDYQAEVLSITSGQVRVEVTHT